jgi:phage gpG-like protein
MDTRRKAIRDVNKTKKNVKKALVAKAKEIDPAGKSAFVGVMAGSSNYGEPIAEYGAKHEFGIAGMPERSFLRVPIHEGKGQISAVAKETLQAGGTAQNALDAMGLTGVNLSSDSFDKNDWKPNSEYTKKKKGSSKVLVDSGALRQSIDYVVR